MTTEPRVLLLDTSGQRGTIALAAGETVLGVRTLDETRRHARDLAPRAQALLTEQGWRSRDVQLVVVSRGPGSYTGLRVGVMAAKAFAYATGCALVAVDTFAIIASQAPPDASRLVVIADAQKDKVYAQTFERQPDGSFRPGSELAIVPVAVLLSGLRPGDRLSGPGVAKCENRLPDGITVVAAGLREPQPEALLPLGLARYHNGERDDVFALEPLYLRPSSAEEQWQALGRP
jgi:tRNA threonylcarbamoyladenosine biosynthesis protein TsaB